MSWKGPDQYHNSNYERGQEMQHQIVGLRFKVLFDQNMNHELYVVELLTRSGQSRLVQAFGVEKISQDVPYICFD